MGMFVYSLTAKYGSTDACLLENPLIFYMKNYFQKLILKILHLCKSIKYFYMSDADQEMKIIDYDLAYHLYFRRC